MQNQTLAGTALLVMDVQNAIVKTLKDPNYYLHSIARTLKAARHASIPVIFVTIGFRKGFPEVHPNNKAFSAIKDSGSILDTPEGCQVPQSIAPRPDETIVTKKRFSAFTGSDLEVILRAKQINHLVLAGLSTSGVVLSTIREASDKDFQLTVLVDGCEDRDEQLHQVLMEKIFPRQATITTIDDWSAYLAALS
ncbi:MAG TPA: isochorismatase family cysteine hydrolase [Arachidicoccus sp.]|nr:isochorismatase family cysteine hydrolase [Arachidicoccus sp.]